MELCKNLNLILATTPIAAGDLKLGIQGDCEKKVNEIASRAQIIHWEICCLIIDEIDSLIPDRSKESNQHTGDLQGVLLAILDGVKKTPNLKIFGTTNFLKKIDEAFLRRMEIRLFLGNPSRLARVKWILNFVRKIDPEEKSEAV